VLKELTELSILPCIAMVSQEKHLEQLVQSTPLDWDKADAVNVAFLSLVNSAYWGFLERRDLRPGSDEAAVLLTSVAFARSQQRGELVDFNFVFPHVQKGVSRESFDFAELEAQIIGAGQSRTGARLTLQHRMQFFFFTIVESTLFNVCFALAVCINGVYILAEDAVRDDANDDHIVWFVMEFFFVVVFTFEFALKLLAYGRVYFCDGWNVFDLLLVISGIFGLVLSVITRVQDIKNNADVSNEARIIRVSKILKVMRLLRLFRLVRFWKKISAKLQNQEMSFEVADYMSKMSILQCFIKAHLSAQSEFYQYFCGDSQKEPVQSVEVARCMLQSQVFIYRASILAAAQLQDLDKRFLHEVNCIKESKDVTEELENFVMRAFGKGVITSREAEAIVRPLHSHIKDCMKLIQKSEAGVGLQKGELVSCLTKSSWIDKQHLESCESPLDVAKRCSQVSKLSDDGGAPAASSTDPFRPIIPNTDAASASSSTDPYRGHQDAVKALIE
jgi:hypothetical protein